MPIAEAFAPSQRASGAKAIVCTNAVHPTDAMSFIFANMMHIITPQKTFFECVDKCVDKGSHSVGAWMHGGVIRGLNSFHNELQSKIIGFFSGEHEKRPL